MKKLYVAPSIKVYGVEMEKSVLSSSGYGDVTNSDSNKPTLEDLDRSDKGDICPPYPPK